MGNSVAFNVIVTDATGNSIAHTPDALGYNSAPTLTIVPTSNPIDSLDTEVYTITASKGTGTLFNVELYNVSGSSQQGSNVLITSIGGSNTVSFVVTSPTEGNTFIFNAIAYDEGTTTPYTFNSGQNTITVNTLKAPNIIPSSATILDAGQSITITATIPAGFIGVGPYTYNFIVFNSITNIIIANQLYTSVLTTSNSYTFTSNSNLVGNTLNANAIVKDFLLTNVNTPNTGLITINAALVENKLYSTNSVIDQGQTETFQLIWSPGTPSTTLNVLLSNTVNSIPIIYNSITTSSCSFSCSLPFSFVMPQTTNALGTLTYSGNIIDSATTPTNYLLTNTITINLALTIPTIILSNSPIIDSGQTEVFTGAASGGLHHTPTTSKYSTV